MLATVDYLDIMASALSAQTGVKITAGDTWNADIKKNIIEYVKEDLYKFDFTVAKGLLLHEISHLKYTTNYPQLPIEEKYPEATHNAVNAFEDLRIENKSSAVWGKFFSMPINALYEHVTRTSIRDNHKDFSKQARLNQFLHLVILIWGSRAYNLWPIIGAGASGILKKTPPIINFNQEVIDRVNKNYNTIYGILARVTCVNTTEDLAKVLDQQLYPLIPDYLEEYEKQAQQQKMGQAAAQSAKDLIDKMLQSKRNGRDPDLNTVKQYKGQVMPDEAEVMYEYGARARVLGQRLNDILEERKATRYLGNHKMGRLLSKNVFKVGLDESNIFSRKSNNLPDKYVFYFCLDNSGSMGGKNAVNAITGAYILKFALQPFKLPFKFFKYDTEAQELDSLSEYDGRGGGTLDYSVLSEVYKDFKNYPDYEKIVFVLTDGQTDTDNNRDKLIKDIENKNGKIIGIGIGLEGEWLKDTYKNIIGVPNPEELPNTFIQIIRNVVNR